jgi:hypothetical protein
MPPLSAFAVGFFESLRRLVDQPLTGLAPFHAAFEDWPPSGLEGDGVTVAIGALIEAIIEVTVEGPQRVRAVGAAIYS